MNVGPSTFSLGGLQGGKTPSSVPAGEILGPGLLDHGICCAPSCEDEVDLGKRVIL